MAFFSRLLGRPQANEAGPADPPQEGVGFRNSLFGMFRSAHTEAATSGVGADDLLEDFEDLEPPPVPVNHLSRATIGLEPLRGEDAMAYSEQLLEHAPVAKEKFESALAAWKGDEEQLQALDASSELTPIAARLQVRARALREGGQMLIRGGYGSSSSSAINLVADHMPAEYAHLPGVVNAKTPLLMLNHKLNHFVSEIADRLMEVLDVRQLVALTSDSFKRIEEDLMKHLLSLLVPHYHENALPVANSIIRFLKAQVAKHEKKEQLKNVINIKAGQWHVDQSALQTIMFAFSEHRDEETAVKAIQELGEIDKASAEEFIHLFAAPCGSENWNRPTLFERKQVLVDNMIKAQAESWNIDECLHNVMEMYVLKGNMEDAVAAIQAMKPDLSRAEIEAFITATAKARSKRQKRRIEKKQKEWNAIGLIPIIERFIASGDMQAAVKEVQQINRDLEASAIEDFILKTVESGKRKQRELAVTKQAEWGIRLEGSLEVGQIHAMRPDLLVDEITAFLNALNQKQVALVVHDAFYSFINYHLKTGDDRVFRAVCALQQQPRRLADRDRDWLAQVLGGEHYVQPFIDGLESNPDALEDVVRALYTQESHRALEVKDALLWLPSLVQDEAVGRALVLDQDIENVAETVVLAVDNTIALIKDLVALLPKGFRDLFHQNVYNFETDQLHPSLYVPLVTFLKELLPGTEVKELSKNLMGNLRSGIPLRDAVRLSVYQTAENRLPLGGDFVNGLLGEASSWLPPSGRMLLQDKGIGAKAPVWYQLKKMADGYELKVHAVVGDDLTQITYYGLKEDQLTEDFFYQLLAFRKKPELADVSYGFAHIKEFLDKMLIPPQEEGIVARATRAIYAPSSTSVIEPSDDPFAPQDPEQRILHQMLQTGDALFEMRMQAIAESTDLEEIEAVHAEAIKRDRGLDTQAKYTGALATVEEQFKRDPFVPKEALHALVGQVLANMGLNSSQLISFVEAALKGPMGEAFEEVKYVMLALLPEDNEMMKREGIWSAVTAARAGATGSASKRGLLRVAGTALDIANMPRRLIARKGSNIGVSSRLLQAAAYLGGRFAIGDALRDEIADQVHTLQSDFFRRENNEIKKFRHVVKLVRNFCAGGLKPVDVSSDEGLFVNRGGIIRLLGDERYFIDANQWIDAQHPFTKFLVLRTDGKEEQIFVNERLSMSTGMGVLQPLTGLERAAYVEQIAYDAIEGAAGLEDKKRLYSYKVVGGKLTSDRAEDMAFLALKYLSEGRYRLAEQAFDQLQAMIDGPVSEDTLAILRHLHAVSTVVKHRSALVLQLKIAALCEGRLPVTESSKWDYVELAAMQVMMERYLEVKHRFAVAPISEEQESMLLDGIANRLKRQLQNHGVAALQDAPAALLEMLRPMLSAPMHGALHSIIETSVSYAGSIVGDTSAISNEILSLLMLPRVGKRYHQLRPKEGLVEDALDGAGLRLSHEFITSMAVEAISDQVDQFKGTLFFEDDKADVPPFAPLSRFAIPSHKEFNPKEFQIQFLNYYNIACSDPERLKPYLVHVNGVYDPLTNFMLKLLSKVVDNPSAYPEPGADIKAFFKEIKVIAFPVPEVEMLDVTIVKEASSLAVSLSARTIASTVASGIASYLGFESVAAAGELAGMAVDAEFLRRGNATPALKTAGRMIAKPIIAGGATMVAGPLAGAVASVAYDVAATYLPMRGMIDPALGAASRLVPRIFSEAVEYIDESLE